MKEIIINIKQLTKKTIHFTSKISFRKKTNILEKIMNGITMIPAPLGVGDVWLLLSVGISSKDVFLNKTIIFFNDKTQKKYNIRGIKKTVIF